MGLAHLQNLIAEILLLPLAFLRAVAGLLGPPWLKICPVQGRNLVEVEVTYGYPLLTPP